MFFSDYYGMGIVDSWRKSGERYYLTGGTCPSCKSNYVYERSVCPNCKSKLENGTTNTADSVINEDSGNQDSWGNFPLVLIGWAAAEKSLSR
jgi:hypothetical protein